jgi:hypothetical protein
MANVLFFMVVQTLFFILVASNQYEEVLMGKLDMVKNFVKRNPEIEKNLKKMKEKNLIELEEIANKQKTERKKINDELIWSKCGIPILIGIAVLFLIIFFMKPDRDWNSVDNLGLIFVTLAYSTELLFFFFIVRKYEFVGDQHIVSTFTRGILN